MLVIAFELMRTKVNHGMAQSETANISLFIMPIIVGTC